MNSPLRQPLFWLLVQALLFGCVLGWTGRLAPRRAADTSSYERFPFHSLEAALSHARTGGYPAFLYAVGKLAPEYQAVPIGQWIVHVVAVIGFHAGVGAVLRCRWTRLAAASSLLYSNVVWRYVAELTADSLASSSSILTIGLLLRAVGDDFRPEGASRVEGAEGSPHRFTDRWGRGLLVGLGVFVTYQIRPAYLFLVPLVPILGWLLVPLLRCRNPLPDARPGFASRRAALALSAVCVLPLLAFCSLRWSTVGQFSLVSFSGNNFVGVVGVFLTPELVPELPADLRPLAQAAIQRRQHVRKSDPDYSDEFTLDYMEIERRFDTNTWKVFVEAARQAHGDDQKKINSELRRLATSIVRARPWYYLLWLGKAAWRGVYMIVSEIVANPVYLLLLMILAAAQAHYVIGRLRPGATFPSAEFQRQDLIEVNALLLVAVSFAALKLMLVILTTPPLGRFMDPAGVFLPTVLVTEIARRVSVARMPVDTG